MVFLPSQVRTDFMSWEQYPTTYPCYLSTMDPKFVNRSPSRMTVAISMSAVPLVSCFVSNSIMGPPVKPKQIVGEQGKAILSLRNGKDRSLSLL